MEATETLDARAMVLEALMTGLRTYAGVDLKRIRGRWITDLTQTNASLLERLQSDGLATMEEERLIPTLDGLAVADSLATRFRLQ